MMSSAYGAGTLNPVDSGFQPMEIRSHNVDVVINNGFSKTAVSQTFSNPNGARLEAIYAFPVPQSASLSNVTIWVGEKELQGEVVANTKADQVYASEQQAGNDAGKATESADRRYEFSVSGIDPGAEVRMRIVYYQPIDIEGGVGRYLYPLEEGGTDEAASAFWSMNESIAGDFSIQVTLRSNWEVVDIRTPGFPGQAQEIAPGVNGYQFRSEGGSLDRDFVLYYRLAENLPGRLEVLPFRSAEDKPGTLMMVLTPGIDLAPITGGADYVFVLDTSGSMSSKLHTLVDGVAKSLEGLNPEDRYRVITFNGAAKEVVGNWTPASRSNVERTLNTLRGVTSGGGTNVYAGLKQGLEKLDEDRATSVVLVTDGVTNTGIVEPKEFRKLLQSVDVRVFGFLLGNSSNWPLLETITETSGGFYQAVSNQDDIVGQLVRAREKVRTEALHDVKIEVRGGHITDLSSTEIGKMYRGEQLVLFGRYHKAGPAEVILKARITGEDKEYRTSISLPEIDTTYPELERLWALDQIESLQKKARLGDLDPKESAEAVRDLGINYQLVTDETSMVVLDDEAFKRHGIERKNQQRTRAEQLAQSQRSQQTPPSQRADQSMFPSNAPRIGGGGAFPPAAALVLLGLGAALLSRKVVRKS